MNDRMIGSVALHDGSTTGSHTWRTADARESWSTVSSDDAASAAVPLGLILARERHTHLVRLIVANDESTVGLREGLVDLIEMNLEWARAEVAATNFSGDRADVLRQIDGFEKVFRYGRALEHGALLLDSPVVVAEREPPIFMESALFAATCAYERSTPSNHAWRRLVVAQVGKDAASLDLMRDVTLVLRGAIGMLKLHDLRPAHDLLTLNNGQFGRVAHARQTYVHRWSMFVCIVNSNMDEKGAKSQLEPLSDTRNVCVLDVGTSVEIARMAETYDMRYESHVDANPENWLGSALSNGGMRLRVTG